MTYVTGITALNILWPGRAPADWHTHGLINRQGWSWAGVQLTSTDHLLGNQGLHDATKILRRYAPNTPAGTLAASYERAVFDLLYQAAVTGKPVPNIQAKDIDDAVDFELVKHWICSIGLPEQQKAAMLAWFRFC